MKKILVLASMITAGLFLSAWSYDQMKIDDEKIPQLRKELELRKFERVSLCCGITLHLITAEDKVFYAEGKESDLENLKIEYKDSRLSIVREKDGWRGWNFFKGDGPIDVYLSAKGMNALSASSGSEVMIDAVYKTPNLELDMSSGASAVLNLNVDNLSIECSSGSELSLSGIALDTEIDISSGSECSARTLSVYKNAKIEASSGSMVAITVQGKVIGDVSSGAEIDIYGFPYEVKKDVSSGGSLNLVDKK